MRAGSIPAVEPRFLEELVNLTPERPVNGRIAAPTKPEFRVDGHHSSVSAATSVERAIFAKLEPKCVVANAAPLLGVSLQGRATVAQPGSVEEA